MAPASFVSKELHNVYWQDIDALTKGPRSSVQLVVF